MNFKSIFQQTLTGTLAATLAMASLLSTSASADGNNTLGVPSIAIADGNTLAAAGTGLLVTQTGAINISIPEGASVKQVLLYWHGYHGPLSSGDNTITIAGNNVTGVLIGGPVKVNNSTAGSAYRADITSLGLLSTGTNSLDIEGLTYELGDHGAGLLVVLDNGVPGKLDIRDGNDFVFISVNDTAVTQTYTYTSSTLERTATLKMLFASVRGTQSGLGFRPTSIRVSIPGSPDQFYDNLLDSTDDEEWDTLSLDIVIPAGATKLTVVPLSQDRLSIGGTPASFHWIASGLNVPGPCTGQIGDFVWHDLNRNGIQNANEPGIDGATIHLRDAAGTTLSTTTSGPNGFYAFKELCAGTYTVHVDENTLPPDVRTPTLVNVGDPALDSDGPLDGSGANVTLTTDNSNNLTVDFGYESPCTGSIGDFVWQDTNSNGLQDTNEKGIDGVKLNLLDINGEIIAMTTSANNGAYVFTGLCIGNYLVDVDESTLPPGVTPTATMTGTDTTIDSNGPQDLGAAQVTLSSNDSQNKTIDFGYIPACTGSIGDYVWKDLNADGLQGANEPGIEGAKVNLLNAAGKVVTMTSTDKKGFYEFSGLCAGDYQVDIVESSLPASLSPTLTRAGNDPAVDSDQPQNQGPVSVSLTENDSTDPTIDFGFIQACAGQIGDFVWNDKNANGIQDANEPGISAVKLTLKDSRGVVAGMTTTGSQGQYNFTGLCTGKYFIEVDPKTLPAGYQPSPSLLGNDRAVDSNGSPTMTTLLNDLGIDETIDFGFGKCARCEGKVAILTLRYLGKSPAQIRVEQTKGGTVVYDAMVKPGDIFTVSGMDKNATLGTEIKLYVNGTLDTSIHTSCSKPIGPGLIKGQFEVMAAVSRTGGIICPIKTPPVDCQQCEGKVTKLSLQYNGSKAAMIMVKQKKDGAIVFQGKVAAGATFTFSGKDDKGTLGTEIIIFVDGAEHTRIHTSCSKPIGPGLIKGDFEVIKAYSRNGGEICPIDLDPDDPRGCPGKDSGKDSSKDSGKDSGKDSSKDSGKDSGKGNSKNSGKDSGKGSSKDSGKDSGKDSCKDSGKDSGKDSSKDSGKGSGKDSSKDSGKDSSSYKPWYWSYMYK